MISLLELHPDLVFGVRSHLTVEKMDKLMGRLTNEKVSDYIPNDLAFSILSKLPLKSLKRFTCVCKSWSLLFKNPHFISMYRYNFASNNHFSYVDDTCLSIELTLPHYEFRYALYLYSGERFENRVKLDWPPPFQEDDEGICILGSLVDGTLCLYQRDTKIVLWNPTMDEFKVLPPSPLESPPPSYHSVLCRLHGFGYDRVRDDQKVIRHVAYILRHTDFEGFIPPHDSIWEIYSLRSNTWRKLDVDMPSGIRRSSGCHLHMNGVCHWWDGDGEYIVSFDLSNEVSFTTPLPSYINDSFDFGLVERRFMGLNGSIVLISNYAKTTTTFHISILGELGVKESWTKLFIVGPLPCVEQPIGAGKKGDIFFRTKDDELIRFDLSTQMIEKLGIKVQLQSSDIVLYKEIRLPFGGPIGI